MAEKQKKGRSTPAEICRRAALMAEPAAAEDGAEVVDVEYLPEGAQWVLRVVIDKEGGVDLDDCARVSRRLSAALDEENLIPQAFVLEVSSPGVERPLKKEADFHRFTGRMISVHTKEPFAGYTQFTGILTAYNEAGLTLAHDEESVTIPLSLVEKARLAYWRDSDDIRGDEVNEHGVH